MSLKKEAIRSVISNWIGTFFRYVLTFVATPIIVHSLGNNKYGIWSLVISLTGYYGIIDFGIRSTVEKYFSQFAAEGDESRCNALINTVTLVYIIIAVLVFISTALLAFNFDVIFKIDDNYKRETFLVVIIIGGNLALRFCFTAFSAIVAALRRFDIQNAVHVTLVICRVLTIIGILKLGYGLIAMAVVVVCFDMIESIVYLTVAFKLYDGLRISVKHIRFSMIKEIYSFAGGSFLIHCSRIIAERTDQILIVLLFGTELVVYYAIAESLVNYVRKVPKGVINTLLPFASYLDATGGEKNLKVLFYFLPKYVFSFSLFILFLFFEYGRNIIDLWMGDGFGDSYLLLIILMTADSIVRTTNVIGRTLAGMGRNREYVIVSVVEMLLNIVLGVILANHWGIVGIALGKLISVSFTRCLVLPFLLGRLSFFSIATFCHKSLFPPVALFSLLFIFYTIIIHFIALK